MAQKASAGAVSSQRWLCRLPGSRGSHGAVLEEPRVQASVLTLPALVTKAAGTRHNPTASAGTHQAPVAEARRAVHVEKSKHKSTVLLLWPLPTM